jgi:hypothetical protein
MSATRLVTLLTVCACFVGAVAPAAAAPVSVRVTVRNLAPANGLYLTPVWVGFHNGSFDVYDAGSPASMALERLAEDGDTMPLSMDFTASGAGMTQATLLGPTIPPIAPGEWTSMVFVLDSASAMNRYLSFASMIIPSNDGFIGNDNPMGLEVFDAMGGFVGGSYLVTGNMVMDAGTEVNDEIPMNTAFFGQMMPNTGTPEGSVVMMHPGFLPPGSGGILDDPMFANADFRAMGYNVAVCAGGRVAGSCTCRAGAAA